VTSWALERGSPRRWLNPRGYDAAQIIDYGAHLGALAPGRAPGFFGFVDEHLSRVRPAFIFEGLGWHRFEMSLTEFLLMLFSNMLIIDSLDYWFDEFPRFIPDRGECQGERLDPISYFAA